MSFYKYRVYPFLVDRLGNPPPIKNIREQLVPLAKGTVAEIGVGSGLNFDYYDTGKVGKLYALEPNPGMVLLSTRRLEGVNLNIEFIDLEGEGLPLDDNSIDTVVSTFTLGSIPEIDTALTELRRILKPEGMLLFFELGRAPDLLVQRWQRLFEPLVKKLFQGLYLTRDIPVLITQGNFHITKIEMGYMTKFPKFLSYCWWGSAIVHSNHDEEEK
jgi:ubiquinone/menaquinone biosynthesis C-methylase UbiE